MSSFTTELRVHPLENGTDWVVDEPFTYYVGELDSDVKVEVTVGFVTDFASVPRMFWSIIPPWGKYGKAAVIHDWLWREQPLNIRGVDTIVSKKTANLTFLEAMGVLDVNVCIRYPMYWAVSLNSQVIQPLVGKIKTLLGK